jgi:hypothetical protein
LLNTVFFRPRMRLSFQWIHEVSKSPHQKQKPLKHGSSERQLLPIGHYLAIANSGNRIIL